MHTLLVRKGFHCEILTKNGLPSKVQSCLEKWKKNERERKYEIWLKTLRQNWQTGDAKRHRMNPDWTLTDLSCDRSSDQQRQVN